MIAGIFGLLAGFAIGWIAANVRVYFICKQLDDAVERLLGCHERYKDLMNEREGLIDERKKLLDRKREMEGEVSLNRELAARLKQEVDSTKEPTSQARQLSTSQNLE